MASSGAMFSGAARGSALRSAAILALVATAACAPGRAPLPVERPATPAIVAEAAAVEPMTRSTILAGEVPVPAPPGAVTVNAKRGEISVNLPAADVRVVARAVLGDLLRVPYSIAPGVSGSMAFVTPGPVARYSLLALFEAALKSSNLALVSIDGGFQIQSASAAQGNGPVAAGAIGYGSEVVPLQFINAAQLKALLDTVLPGVATVPAEGANTITITGTTGQRGSARDLVRQFDVNWLRAMSFALFVPERTDSRLIAPELDKLLNAPDAPTRGLVRLLQLERLNGILAISAQPQYLEDVRRWVEILDREGQSSEPRLFVYKVQNGRARDLAQTINAAFGNATGAAGQTGNPDPFAQTAGTTGETGTGGQSTTAALVQPPATAAASAVPGTASMAGGTAAGAQSGRITADEANNAILVYGTPRQYAVVEDALRRLDLRPVQIMIEAAITEVTLNDALRYGVQWNFATGTSDFSLRDGSAVNAARKAPGFSYFLSGSDISVALNALEQRTNVKVISAPKVLVLNNQTAALQVGDQVPISTAAATNLNGGGGSIVNSIEYRDTGVILKVTPRVNASGLVLLDISQEVSDVNTRASSGTQSAEQSPTISTRRIATSIAAQDGQVIALGGLFRNAQTLGRNGLPILSRLPVLGALFGNHVNDQVRTELVVLLKPHVIRTVDDGTAITEELRAKLRTLEPFRTEGRIP